MKTLLLTVLLLLGLSTPAWATNYYISPTGSDGANGTTTSTPWLTFTYAFAHMAGSPTGCGHTLNLMNGVYGDGTSTGTIVLSGKVCTSGNELTVRALNQRQARIHTDASGIGVYLHSLTAGIILDGLVVSSISTAGQTCSTCGIPFYANNTDRITIKNSLGRNPNKYANTHVFFFVNSRDGLVEDTEIYDYHRHAIIFFTSQRMVARRVYANGRVGAITGGYNSGVAIGASGAVVSMYPCFTCLVENSIGEGKGFLTEMNATFNASILMKDSQVLGSIQTGTGAANNGLYLAGRDTSGDNHSPQTDTVRDVAIVGSTRGADCIKVQDPISITVDNVTCLGTGTGNGLSMSDQANIGGTTMSATFTDSIAQGFGATGVKRSTVQTYSGSNNFSNGNGTAFDPAAASWGANNVTTDPQLGTCLLWPPDGSNAAVAGVGATILYRYENGNLTDTPLWDPTTGEFPHGATDLDGTNDDVGDSLFDIQTRLHVNTGGCSFPSGYAGGSGGAPANPATMVTSEGVTSTTHNHTIPANTDFLLQCIVLINVGGDVGSVSAASSGGEALTLIAAITNAPSNSRRAELWQRTAPTSGVRSQVVTTTGNVDGTRTTSIEAEGYSAIGANATATALSSTPSVTVVTNTGETIYDCLAGKKGVYLSSGEDQTLQRNDEVATGDLISAISTQSGDDGGVMTHVMGGNNYWALATVSMLPTSPDPPVTPCTLTQVAGQVDSAFLVNDAVVHLGAVNAANVAVDVGTSFAVTLQTDATVAACATAGRKLYVSYDGGAYAAVSDTMTNGLSFFGATADPLVVSGAVSTNLSGVLTNVPGTTIHSASVNPMATMTQDDSLVNRWVLKLDPTAVDTHTFEFREYTDSGIPLDSYGATADAKITVTGTAPVISAPAALTLVGPSSNTIVELIWAPSTYATFAGYRLYRGTATGVYGASPIATITPASAAARHTPQTRYLDLTHAAGTYYYVVTAFDLDNNESPVSNEVSITMTGFTARGAP